MPDTGRRVRHGSGAHVAIAVSSGAEARDGQDEHVVDGLGAATAVDVEAAEGVPAEAGLFVQPGLGRGRDGGRAGESQGADERQFLLRRGRVRAAAVVRGDGRDQLRERVHEAEEDRVCRRRGQRPLRQLHRVRVAHAPVVVLVGVAVGFDAQHEGNRLGRFECRSGHGVGPGREVVGRDP